MGEWRHGDRRSRARLIATVIASVSAAVVLAALLPASVLAAGCTESWAEAKNGSWSVAANWSPEKVPAASDEVCISVPGEYTVALTGSVSVKSLTLGAASDSTKQTLLVGGPLASGTLSLATDSTITEAGVLDMESELATSAVVKAPAAATIANEGEVLTSTSAVNYLEASVVSAVGAAVKVVGGELRQDDNTTTTNEGAFEVAAGAVFAATSSTDLFVNRGSLVDGGSFSLSGDASWTQEAGTEPQSGNPVSIFNSGSLTDVSGAGRFDLIDTASLSGTVPVGQTVTAEALPEHDARVVISGTVVNEGTLALDSPSKGGPPELVEASGSSLIENLGVLSAQSESGAVGHLQVALINGVAGIVEVKSGEFRQDDNTTTTNEGIFEVDSGAVFEAASSKDLFVNDAKAPEGVIDNGTIGLTGDASWTQNGSESGNPVSIFNGGVLTDKAGAGRFDLIDTAGLSGTIPVGQTVTAEALPEHDARVVISGTVVNEGTLALDSPSKGGAPELVEASGSSLIENLGVLSTQSESTSIDDLQVALTNEALGSVEVKSGEFRQDDNTTTTNEGTFEVAAGAVFAATSSADLFVNKGPLVNVGAVSLSGDASWRQEAGGAAESGNPVSIFSSGMLTDVSGAGGFDLLDTAGLSGMIPKGQMVRAESRSGHNAVVELAGGEVVNEGTFVLDETTTSPAEVVGNGTTLVNKGVIEAQAAESSYINHLQASLVNAADGSVDVLSGELRQDDNTTTTNEGTFQVTAGAVFGATSSKDLFVNKGSLVNSGSVSFSGDASWTQEAGGAVQSGNPVSIFNSGALSDVSGVGSFDLVDTAGLNGTIPEGQTVTAQALPEHNAQVVISGTVVNEGTLALDSPSKGGTPELNAASGSSKIENLGVLSSQSESTSVDHLKVALTNETPGSVEVKSGELRQDDNTTTINEGVFEVDSEAVFGATSSKDLFVNDATAPQGVVDHGTIDLTSDASWTQDGSESGNPVSIFNSGALSDVSGVGSFDLVDTAGLNGTIPKGQTVTAQALPEHNAQVVISSTVVNEGTLALDSPSKGGVPELVAGSGSSLIENLGVLSSQSESGSVDHLKVALTNEAPGSVEVKSGELRQDDNTTTTNEGTFHIAAGAVFAATSSTDLFVNRGSLVDGGSVSLTGDASWTQEAGGAAESGNPVSIFNSGRLTDVSGTGSFDLLDTAGLGGTIPSEQTVRAESRSGHNAVVELAGGEVVNEGTFVFDETTTSPAEVVGNGTTLVNKGIIDAQAAESSYVNYLEADLVNAVGGSLKVESGELRQDDNTTTTNEGTFHIAAGAVFAATSSKDLFVNAANGTLQPDIAGETSFGVFKVSGGATFTPGGTILPNLVGSYAPAVGTEFDVITGTAPIRGEFAAVANNFLGDYSKAGSSPSAIAVKRDRDSTATELTALPESSTHGQSVTFTATITTGPGPVGSPTGTVKFADGGTELGTGEVTTSAGKTTAALTTSTLSVGHHEIIATYGGDANSAASSSPAAEVTIDAARPTVTEIEPAAGPTTGGTTVKIEGKEFLAGSTVTVGGVGASEVNVVDEEEVTAKTPAGVAGQQAVIVTDTGGSSSGATTFTYTPPTVTAVEPASGPTGGGTTVTIKGKGFVAGSTVAIGGAASSVKVLSEAEITATTPAFAAGSEEVVVTDTGGSSTKGPTYTFVAPVPTKEGEGGGGGGGGTELKAQISINKEPTTTLVPPPVLAKTGNVAPVSGTVSVRVPGSSSSVALSEVRQIPFGSIIDATEGSVSITSTEPDGATQTGTFFDGEFILTQGKNGVLVATLTGGNFSVCPTAKERSHIARTSSNVARASAKHAAPSHVVRKLWANAHGSFSTKGNYAAGAVLGTEWLTEDLCDGTLIKVTRDKVAVTNLVNHHKVTVKTGHQYLAKAP